MKKLVKKYLKKSEEFYPNSLKYKLGESMSLDPMLLEILACPEDKGPLFYLEDENSLYNPRLRRLYRIEDDIPIMLTDEAREVDESEHARIIEKVESSGISLTFEA